MERFGFAISKGRQIDYDANSRHIAGYISEREPSFRVCIECGCCAATCTTGNFTSFSLRELHILLKRGENESVRENIKKCIDVLVDNNYDGVVSLECEGQGGPMIEKSLAFVREVVADANARLAKK